MRQPSTHVEELLAEIDADPTGIFWASPKPPAKNGGLGTRSQIRASDVPVRSRPSVYALAARRRISRNEGVFVPKASNGTVRI
jgi:hypothetical protein